MMLADCRKTAGQLYTLLAGLLCSCLLYAAPASESDCRPALPVERAHTQLEYADAVLWEISRDDREPSYIFGTIHVSDPGVTALPAVVREKLDAAAVFVMEALPDPEEVRKFSDMMFFENSTTLQDYLDNGLYTRTSNILSRYNLAPLSVPRLRPWAAFLIMNYPAEQGTPLDLELLAVARENGAELHGLESLTDQGRVFSEIEPEVQVRLLLDTVCNYDALEDDFEIMKSLYLQRDLSTLYSYSNKYSFSQEKIYQDLLKKILTDRNRIMADRMQSFLERGDAFIAIGALHLPGSDGVLSLLAAEGYRVTPVY